MDVIKRCFFLSSNPRIGYYFVDILFDNVKKTNYLALKLLIIAIKTLFPTLSLCLKSKYY